MAEPEIPDAPGGAPNQTPDPEATTGPSPVVAENEESAPAPTAVSTETEEQAQTGTQPVAAENEGIAPAPTESVETGALPVAAEQEDPAAEPTEPVETGALPLTAEEELAAAAQTAAATDVADLLGEEVAPPEAPAEDLELRAVLEAIVYVAEDPLPLAQLAAALNQPQERIQALMEELIAEFDRPLHGVAIREVAGGYKMTTKPEHHEAVRNFVRSLKPPLKLSLAALETLAVIAYKQPITAPEIMEIRGVQGAGVLKTLLDRKLIAAAGRKNVIGKPILYKTTKEFLVQFGLKDLAELPSLKEFEELRRMAFSDSEPEPPAAEAAAPASDPPEETPAEAPAAAEEPEPATPES